MPILKRNKHRYPLDWPRIRQDILARASNCCERCGVANHAVGYRDRAGTFHPLSGSPPLPYAEARELANEFNESNVRWFVVVLTIAHLDHTPEHNDPANLQALCQRCHNRLDAAHRADTRKKIPNQLELYP
jgi:5-methylcytosine-specific restriction endonuclease McrA